MEVLTVMMTYDDKKIFYSNGYPAVYINGKLIRVHVLEMEKKLGRKLRKGECVHHKDENKHNYDISNLICFATNADHICFHKGGEIWFDDEGIAHCYIRTQKIDHKTSRYELCPICGGLMSFGSKQCMMCYHQSAVKPEQSVLLQDLQNLKTLEAVGHKYGVTGNSVKKWCKSYNIYQSSHHDLPNKQNFIKYMKTHTIAEAALHYDVTRDVIVNWIRRLGITIIPQQIMCVETGVIFDSALAVGRMMFPERSVKSVGNIIGRALQKGTKELGYHWQYTDKIVR